ncbi:MAG: TonB-dependent receptor [Patiriisocius sp.]
MKYYAFIFLLSAGILQAQEKLQDTTKIQALEQVYLNGVRVAADSPITHSNLTKQDLAKRNLGQDIPVLLNYLPGVVTTSDAGAGVGYTGIRVRGSDATRVNVTINGIPYNDSESQGTFWVNLPDFASSIESLQLQRGVGSSTNGSGSFGASLNIDTDRSSKEAYAQIANSYGSFDTRKHSVKFSTGLLNDRVEISGRVSNITSDGYIDRASSDLKSYFLQGSYKTDNTFIKALVFGGREVTYQSWFGIDEQTLNTNPTFNPAGMYSDEDGTVRFHQNQVDDYDQDHYQLIWNERYNNNWSTSATLNYTKGSGFFEEYKEDASLGFHGLLPVTIDGETSAESDLVRRRWLENNFYALSANANYKDENWDTTTGVFYSYYQGLHFGEVIWATNFTGPNLGDRYYSGTGDKHELTAFSKASYKINNSWSVFGDLQMRIVNYKTAGLTSDKVNMVVDEQYEFFNPKFGASYSLNQGNQLYVSYGRASREPRRSDFEQGVFTPEILDDYELGWRFTGENNTLSANLYYMDYKDQLVLTGQLDDSGGFIRETSGNSYRAGLEVEGDFRVLKQLHVRPNIALSSNKNKDYTTSRDGELVNLGTTNISFSPSFIAGNSIDYSPTQNLQVALLSKYVGEQYLGNIDSQTSKLDAYFLNDFSVNYTITNVSFAKSLVLQGLVNNIFDVKYISNGYFYTYDDDFSTPGTVTTIEGAGFYPQAGINFLVGATLTF